MPDLHGRTAIVTGASDGLGLGLASRLPAAGAEVVLPVRNPTKEPRQQRVFVRSPRQPRVSTCEIDLSSLESNARFSQGMLDEGRPIHILINKRRRDDATNRQSTADGLELQFGTNFLGHFALTAHVLPLLRAGRARVTSQTSFGARGAPFNWDDLQSEHGYDPIKAYNQSTLALMVFALELDRRSRAGGWEITSNVAHPGIPATNLLASHPEMGRSHDTVAVE